MLRNRRELLVANFVSLYPYLADSQQQVLAYLDLNQNSSVQLFVLHQLSLQFQLLDASQALEILLTTFQLLSNQVPSNLSLGEYIYHILSDPNLHTLIQQFENYLEQSTQKKSEYTQIQNINQQQNSMEVEKTERPFIEKPNQKKGNKENLENKEKQKYNQGKSQMIQKQKRSKIQIHSSNEAQNTCNKENQEIQSIAIIKQVKSQEEAKPERKVVKRGVINQLLTQNQIRKQFKKELKA